MKNSLNNISLQDDQLVGYSERSYFSKFFRQDFRPNTKKALHSDFNHFLIWYRGTNNEPFMFQRFTESDVVSYKQKCQQLGHAVNTINRRLTHLRMFCDFAVKEDRMKENIAKKVKSLHVQRLAPKGLEPSDVKKIIKEAEIRGKLRDLLILVMFAEAGFRVSELAAMRIEDLAISERKGYAVVRDGKGGKQREVPLNSRIRELLKTYIAGRNTSEHLFQGQRGALTILAFNKIVDFYAKKAGIMKGVSPHRFRHFFSYNFLSQTQNDIVALADILGHSDIKVTARYAQNRLSDLQEKVEKLSF